MIRRPWLVFDNFNSGDLDDIPLYGNVHIIDDSVLADGSGGPKYITVIDLTDLGGTIATIADLIAAPTQWLEIGGSGEQGGVIWSTAIVYKIGDIVSEVTTNATYTCIVSHTATDADLLAGADKANWEALSVDITSHSFTATAGQTDFPVVYSPAAVEVFSEGVKVDPGSYDATSGTNIIFNDGRDETAWVQVTTNVGLAGATTPWTNITGTPTTVAGYGIIDAMPAAGATSLVTAGTVTTGAWEATPVADAYIASAATWNAKADAATTLAGYGITDAMPDVGATTLVTAGNIATGTWEATPIADAYIASAVTWNAKADAATTLAGYGITDAYTKAEVYTKAEDDALLAVKVDSDITAEAGSIKIDNMIRVTQAIYDTIATPDPAIMYVIVG